VTATANHSSTDSDQALREKLIGRWDITIQTPEGDLPAWLEIQRSGYRTLVGQFVSVAGSARPIARVEISAGSLRFSIPPQWEQGSGDLWVEGGFKAGQLAGAIGFPDSRHFNWTAQPAPSFRPLNAPAFGNQVKLFNEIDLAGWRVLGENHWEVTQGILQNTQTGGNLVTGQEFSDFQLHIEFRYPPGGNSGVYLRGRYEVQILDHPALIPTSHDLGGIYGFLTPSEIVTNGAGEWNAFDITLVGRMVTVMVNGKSVIYNQEIPGITGGALDSNEGSPGPLLLQGDHGPVDYRNILLRSAV
jgi:hypothetical protein